MDIEKPLPKKGFVYGMTLIIFAILMLLSLLFYLTQHDTVKTISLVLFVITFVFGSVYVYLRLTSSTVRFRRKLQEVKSVIYKSSLDKLKQHYHEIHDLYLKVPHHKKKHFHFHLDMLREKLEDMLVAEKQLQHLAKKITKVPMKEKEAIFDEFNSHYKKLPEEAKKKYYHLLVYVRSHLEHGQ